MKGNTTHTAHTTATQTTTPSSKEEEVGILLVKNFVVSQSIVHLEW